MSGPTLKKLQPKSAESQDTSKRNNSRKACFDVGIGILVVGLLHLVLQRDKGFEHFSNSTHTLKQSLNVSSVVLENSTLVDGIGSESNSQQQQSESTTSASSSKKPPYEWDQGCMVGPKPVPPEEEDIHNNKPPSGLAIQLARGTKENAKYVMMLLCSKVPTQQAFFYEPQQLDLLILVSLEGVPITDIANCLNLTKLDIVKKWSNLDGSTLWTNEYKSQTGKGRVFLAPYDMPYPDYIKQNMTILEETIECGRTYDYVQGCRFYSHEGLNLKIATDYEYMLKVDLDIEFNASIPFNLLHDMKMKGAIVGHTAGFPNGLSSCTTDFKDVISTFTTEFGNNETPTVGKEESSWATNVQWRSPCSAGITDFDRGDDKWYTNLIAYRTDFFQSEPVRAFGRWMNEFQPGYFRHGWTDQLFFHHAMGLFLGPDFRDYVADYTNLRCYRYPNCWFFWAGNMDMSNFCEKGGYFVHSKNINNFGKFDGVFPDVVAPLAATPFVNHYEHNCDNLPD